MLKYNLYGISGDFVVYNYYYPDGNGDVGVVAINKRTGEIKIEKTSSDGFGNRFANKLANLLKYFFDTEDYKEAGTIIWY